MEDSYGTKADLYGIGVMFYEMLTGVYPFLTRSTCPEEIYANIENNITKIYSPDYIRENLKKAGK